MWIQDLHVESSSCYVGCEWEQFRRDDHYVVIYLLCHQVVIGVDVCWSGGGVPEMLASFVPQNLILRETGLETYTFILPWNWWFHLPRFLMGVLFRAMGFEKLLISRINVKCWSHEIRTHHKTLQFIVGFRETTSQKISWLCFFFEWKKMLHHLGCTQPCKSWDFKMDS